MITSTLGIAASPDIPVGPDEVFIQGTANNEIKIMSYNLLNLFDAEKDMFSDDWQWLPRDYPGKQQYCASLPSPREQQTCSQFDWTYEKVDWKLNQLKKVVNFQGSLPDVLAVEEVENENALRMLAAKLGYQHYIITNSADRRGIDVGLMFNPRDDFSYVGWESIYVQFASGRPGRDILRVDFTWKNRPLSIYVNHWPSQFNPTDERIASAQALAQNVEKMIQTYGTKWSGVAVGDFNTIDQDQPNPFNDVIHNPAWLNYMYDAEAYARQSPINPSLPYTPPGSYYFIKDDVWNHLDRIVVTKNLIDGTDMEFAQESLRIPFPAFMSFNLRRSNNPPGRSNHNGNHLMTPLDLVNFNEPPAGDYRIIRVPNKYNFETLDESRRGFSDHLPMIFKLRI
jgi:hypothetical protein